MCAPSIIKTSLLKHLKVSNVCNTFSPNRLKETAVLQEVVLWWEATPTYLNPTGCSTYCKGKWEYPYSILEGANEELWAAKFGHDTRIDY